MADSVRTFVAIELPASVKDHLEKLEAQLRRTAPPKVRWVNPEGIHLTLKFLGRVDRERVGDVWGALQKATQGQTRFVLRLEDFGAFPNIRRPRVLWIGVGGELEPLRRLQDRVEEQLVGCGFPPEERSFSPHLTLGRIRDPLLPTEADRLAESLSGVTVDSCIELIATEVSLMTSTLLPSGAMYQCLGAASLQAD